LVLRGEGAIKINAGSLSNTSFYRCKAQGTKKNTTTVDETLKCGFKKPNLFYKWQVGVTRKGIHQFVWGGESTSKQYRLTRKKLNYNFIRLLDN
jgi:hypothetical protein